MKTKGANTDEMIEFFQSASATELRKLESTSNFLFKNESESSLSEDEGNDAMADFFQNLSLDDLKNVQTTPLLIPMLSLEEKSAITGLKKSIILKLETNKENATLKEIMTYCNKLEIPYSQFVPEFYVNFAK